MKVCIVADEVVRRGIDVGEIAAAAARNPNFFTRCFVAFENEYASPAPSCFDRAHQAGRTGTENDDVISHKRIIYSLVIRGQTSKSPKFLHTRVDWNLGDSDV